MSSSKSQTCLEVCTRRSVVFLQFDLVTLKVPSSSDRTRVARSLMGSSLHRPLGSGMEYLTS